MTPEMVIIHLLQLIKICQHQVHWQIAARVGLASLYLDARMSRLTRDIVSEMIANGSLLSHDYLLSDQDFVDVMSELRIPKKPMGHEPN